MTKQWYYMAIKLGHQGPKKFLDVETFVWVRNPLEAITIYKKMGGIKNKYIPDIRPLNSEESLELEKKILEDGLSLDDARKKWYTSTQEYKWW